MEKLRKIKGRNKKKKKVLNRRKQGSDFIEGSKDTDLISAKIEGAQKQSKGQQKSKEREEGARKRGEDQVRVDGERGKVGRGEERCWMGGCAAVWAV